MKLSRLALGLSLSAPALLLASPSALAQTLSGTVTNAAGRPLANATVEIEALKRVTSTNELGQVKTNQRAELFVQHVRCLRYGSGNIPDNLVSSIPMPRTYCCR